jgi:sensor histidine kinase YesM
MNVPILFSSERNRKIAGNTFLAVTLVFIAFGQIPIIISDWNIDRPFIFVQILTVTLIYFGVVSLNIYLFIPRLLFRYKYVYYTAVLFGLAVLFATTGILFEWAMISIYQIPPSEYGFFAGNNIPFLDFLSYVFSNFLGLVATSMIVFLRHWKKSGERIRELEETGIRVALEKERNKINSDALFNTLEKAADIAVSFPQKAFQLLMELSKSLRRQLYESDRKQLFSITPGKKKHLFDEQHHLLNFLTEKRHRLARNLLLAIAFCLIGSGNINLDNAYTFLECTVVSVTFLVLVYINIYILLPRFLLKDKGIEYLFVLLLLVIVLIAAILPFGFVEKINGIVVLYMISMVVKIGFMFAGTTAIVLFQHWARNEQYIAKLEETNMRAELEQLQNQINPHFLFNMLNNILVLIRENPREAVVTLHKMNDMLKYQFNDVTKKEVLLQDDIQFLTDFLNLEKIRRDRFEFNISIENNINNVYVPPLLFIPFVENAVKHSADAVNLSYIRLHFSVMNNRLNFTCSNSKPAKPQKKNEFSGLGLVNIRRRLELLYDKYYSLKIQENETSYTIRLTIKIYRDEMHYC